MANIIGFLKESKEELKKVVWPNREEVLSATMVVLVTVIIISLFLFAMDHIFESAFNSLIRMGTGS